MKVILKSIVTVVFLFLQSMPVGAQSLPIVDAHVHYSHDAWERIPPEQAIDILKQAGLRKAFVSSSSDDGTQMLYAVDPELVVPVLRPYRKRGEIGTWMYDETIPDMLTALLEKNNYAGIGEFHAFGDDIELPVLQRVIELARQHNVFLHAHSDSDAIERIFRHNPDAVVLWAHSGFDSPENIGDMLGRYPNLWSDLAFRSEHGHDGKVVEEWRALFTAFPDRFLVGTDTYTPERWYYIIEHANWSRDWLSDLPAALAENIAYRNAEALLARTGKN